MTFSIITPSFRNSAWLKLCVASVADQGEQVEHIVQDAGSNDGTQDWLPHDPRVKAFIEKDKGMYDAINRGLRRATGDITAWLNCDEQYFPGALKMVREFFETHPETEILFASCVIAGPEGEFLCCRPALVPRIWHTQLCHLSTLSCAMFFRRRIVEQHNLFFDENARHTADAHWVLRALRLGLPVAATRTYTSAFFFTGANISRTEKSACTESEALAAQLPPLVRKLKPLVNVQHRLRKLVHGVYFPKPFAYEVYTRAQPDRRQRFQVDKPRSVWRELPA